MDLGKLEALTFNAQVMKKLPFESKLHGLAALQWSICQDSLSREGTKSGVPSKCPCCKGRGIEDIQYVSNLYKSQTCNECGGTEKKINDDDRCLQCTDSSKAVDKEGMPTFKNNSMKGNLYIHFHVEFPDSLTPDLVKSLAEVVPPRPESKITDTELAKCEETKLHDVEIEDEMQRRKTHEDEDEQMQCD